MCGVYFDAAEVVVQSDHVRRFLASCLEPLPLNPEPFVKPKTSVLDIVILMGILIVEVGLLYFDLKIDLLLTDFLLFRQLFGYCFDRYSKLALL